MNTPFIIAELSANHNHNLDIALKSVTAIANTGANAIKVQTYKPSCLTLPYKNDYFRIHDGLWKDKYLWDLYNQAQMPWEWHEEIFNLAKSLNLVAFSSPFSVKGVDFLEKLDCPMYKIASFEVMHPMLLQAIAKTKKPVILSLGVANDNEIEFALEILRDNAKITLLYCISAYPAPINDAKLTNILTIKQKWQKYNVEVGISDHTLGISVPIVATLCGISMLEKHFILDKNLDSIDSAFSLDSHEFYTMVNSIKDTCILAQDFLTQNTQILNNTTNYFNEKITQQSDSTLDNKTENTKCTPIDKQGREFARSLFIAKDVKAGDTISLDNIACVRPANGMSPLQLHTILGKTFKTDCKGGMPLFKSHINM